MAIVNNLSASNQKRDRLVNNRNGFTFAANITILSFALLLFNTVDDKILQFRFLCLIAMSIGAFSSIFFMLTINEPRLTKEAKEYDAIYKRDVLGEVEKPQEAQTAVKSGKTAKDWLSDTNFYIHGLVYMVVRIAVNVTMTVQPFYLN